MQKELDYRAIVESMADMIIVTDEEGIIQYASPQWEGVLGYHPDQLVGHKRFDFMNEEESQKLKNDFLPYYHKRIPFYMITHNMLHKDGHEVEIESSGTPIFDNQGNFYGYRVSNRDMTTRKIKGQFDRIDDMDAYGTLLGYQEMITTISKMFMDAPFDQLKHRIWESMHEVGKLLDVDRVYIFEFDDSKSKMNNTYEWCNEEIEPAIDILQNLDTDVFPWWMKKLNLDEVINVYDVFTMGKEQVREKDILMEQGIKSVLVVPLRVHQDLIGFIGFDSVKKHKRFRDEIHLLRMYSEIVAYALAKQQDEQRIHDSLEQVKRTFHQTIEAFSSIVEISDPYTAGHQHRVAELAVAIGKHLRLEKDQLEALYMASLLHDLGKFYIPNQILNKPGRLSEIEFNLIKTHPTLGYEVLTKIDFPWPIADMVLQHHERVDGSGYPYGLEKDEIMIESKILCVADVVESISSHRPYRPALGLDFALREIKEQRGTLYDEKVVDACLFLFEHGRFHFKTTV